uniref:Ground-like domain-containing protein n=1 Tax=Parastrongyloides trichosuri TaxID=131310 RepID=A0A0N4Z9W8_PARTI
MFKYIFTTFILLAPTISSFFLGTNNGCGCRTQPCSNPCTTLPAYSGVPSYNPSLQTLPSINGYATAPSKSYGVESFQVPNEMEMRAQLLGLDLNNPLRPSTTGTTYDFNKDLIPDIDLVDQQNVRRSPETSSKDEEKVIELQDDNNKCNSEDLKKIMVENMTEDARESKRAINKGAESFFKQNVAVICSRRGHYSYIFSSDIFCEVSKGPMTCIAFQQFSN